MNLNLSNPLEIIILLVVAGLLPLPRSLPPSPPAPMPLALPPSLPLPLVQSDGSLGA